MGFWRDLGRMGHKIGGTVGDWAGGVAGTLAATGAAIGATGIGLPLAAGVETMAGLAGALAFGGKATDVMSYGADRLGSK